MSEFLIKQITEPVQFYPERLYDGDGNWIGLQLVEEMSREEFARLYPGPTPLVEGK